MKLKLFGGFYVQVPLVMLLFLQVLKGKITREFMFISLATVLATGHFAAYPLQILSSEMWLYRFLPTDSGSSSPQRTPLTQLSRS